MRELLDLLEKIYINLRSDLLHTISYTNFNVLEKLAKNTTGFDEVLADARGIQQYLGQEPELTKDMIEHHTVTSQIFDRINEGKDISNLIEKAALLRRSIG